MTGTAAPPREKTASPRPGSGAAADPHRRAAADPQAGGSAVPSDCSPELSPCTENPERWTVTFRYGKRAARDNVYAALAGCLECRAELPAEFRACLITPRKQRTPLSVMAGAVIDERRDRVHPRVFIARRLTDPVPVPDAAADGAP